MLEDLADITVKEGELVKVEPKATDPDKDEISFIFEQPLNSEGEWQTKEGDAGEYELEVSAWDGKDSATKKVRIVVEPSNRPPVITGVEDITVKEGDTITLNPEVTDPDGDEVTVTYSGWMNTNTYTTTYEDAGEHQVTITASDGKTTTTKTITITVEDVNRPPVFQI